MKYHPVVAEILDLIKKAGCWFETFEHQPVRTSEEAAKIRSGYTLSQGTKALIVRVKKSASEKEFLMLVVPGDVKFSQEKVKKLLAAKDIRFATEEEVHQRTGGVQVGGVPPFGNIFNFKVIADASVFTNEKIIFNAGDRSFSIAMKSEEYKKLVNPLVGDIV